ncbi:MAG: SDR family NAD(P)-dependent oxidoreductase [Bacteroidetes bacterium]|jgi:NADP-dependent 3-hydroxy acid dehydrogenase YdfG|nr:SDR family NAD(P)-dependent oxidoreductase [Bacteroidota bacterium]
MKNIWITGASSGIGRATATIFAKAGGYRLILSARRTIRLEAMKEELQDTYNCEVVSCPLDVRVQKACQAAFNELPDKCKPIDILVNNAGLAKGLAPIHKGNYHHWETMIDTNIKGLLYMSKIVSADMVANSHPGMIINTASTAGKEVYSKGNVYCATKHAVEALTKSMRLDLYKEGIRVGQVAPAHVEETEFAQVRFDGDKKRAKIYEDFNPLQSKDVAEAIYFIATRPPHVNVQDILLMGTQQANSTHIDRSGRKFDA